MFSMVVAPGTCTLLCTHLSDREALAVHFDAVGFLASTTSFAFTVLFLFCVEEGEAQGVFVFEGVGGAVEADKGEERGIWQVLVGFDEAEGR